MIDLYTAPTPNGRKVSIALEEYAVAYSVKAVDLQKNEQFEPDFLKMNPNNKIPVIFDSDRGSALAESGAILIYLAEKYGAFWGEDRLETIQWLMWQMGGLGPMLGQVHYFSRYNSGKSVYAEERFKNEALRLYRVLEVLLSDREFLSYSYSIADMSVWPWISRFEWQGIDLNEFPNILRWYVEIGERPAVVRGYDQPFFVNKIPMP